ncbi:MAG: DUF3800 domain-containing protein [Nitrososphaerales archaeon]
MIAETMKFLYLDAAGDLGYPPPYGKSNSRYYVLLGLSIDPATEWLKARNGLSTIVRKYFPEKSHGPRELHYTDIASKKNPFDKLTGEQRKSLSDEVFNLIRDIHPTLFAIVIDKLAHRKKYASPEQPNILAVRFMVPRFSKYLERISDKGIMIYDSEERQINRQLRNFLFDARDSGVVLEPAQLWYYTQDKLEHLVETIFFIESDSSPIIQLADFCAHVVFLSYERGKSDRFNQIKDMFDSYQGRTYGIREWPTQQS